MGDRPVRYEVSEGGDGLGQAEVVRALYGEIYADPPQSKGPAEVAAFAADWPRRVSAPGFRLVVARDESGQPVGMTFGHGLSADTRWWSGLRDEVPGGFTTEWPGRTFAIIELMVRADRRRQGIATALHERLLAERTEDRVTLLVRPGGPAQAAYLRWGYETAGRLQPFPDAPVYDAMVRPGQG
jgi:GNAT superfamily N-acetyltransferase